VRWQHNFPDFTSAKLAISDWIDWYNRDRPHLSLGYLSPLQYRLQHVHNVA